MRNELASRSRGESFSDRPRSVCPVIASFLRSYNDGVRRRDRGDLYRFASEAIGTRADPQVEGRHAELCRRWAAARHNELPGDVRELLPLYWPSPEAPASAALTGVLTGRIAGMLVRRGQPTAVRRRSSWSSA